MFKLLFISALLISNLVFAQNISEPQIKYQLGLNYNLDTGFYPSNNGTYNPDDVFPKNWTLVFGIKFSTLTFHAGLNSRTEKYTYTYNQKNSFTNTYYTEYLSVPIGVDLSLSNNEEHSFYLSFNYIVDYITKYRNELIPMNNFESKRYFRDNLEFGAGSFFTLYKPLRLKWYVSYLTKSVHINPPLDSHLNISYLRISAGVLVSI